MQPLTFGGDYPIIGAPDRDLERPQRAEDLDSDFAFARGGERPSTLQYGIRQKLPKQPVNIHP
jgi:hypothetical protein